LDHVAAIFNRLGHSRVTIPRTNPEAALIRYVQNPIMVVARRVVGAPNVVVVKIGIGVTDNAVAVVPNNSGSCEVRHESHNGVVLVTRMADMVNEIFHTFAAFEERGLIDEQLCYDGLACCQSFVSAFFEGESKMDHLLLLILLRQLKNEVPHHHRFDGRHDRPSSAGGRRSEN